MGTGEKKVVVLVSLNVLKHKEEQEFAAILEEVGLVGYGSTKRGATDAVKQLFNTFITESRRQGLLEKRLKQLDVNWYWDDEYPVGGRPVEDALTGRRWVSVGDAEALMFSAA